MNAVTDWHIYFCKRARTSFAAALGPRQPVIFTALPVKQVALMKNC